MRVFASVVELGGFARAGVKLDMAPASVTTHVRALESRLGVRLLNRTTRRLSLTDEGRVFFDRCRTIIAEVDETEELVSASRSAPRGRLRIDVPVAVARLFLNEALPEFLQRHPEIRLEVGVTDRMVNLVAEAVDCAIRVSLAPSMDASMVAREVGSTRLVTVASPDYLAKHGAPRTPAELAAHNCVVFRSPDTGKPYDWLFQRDGQRVSLPVSGNLSFNAGHAPLDAAIAGVGLTQTLCFMAHQPVMAGRLQPVLLDWTAQGPPILCIYAHRKHVPAKVRAFVEFATRLFSSGSRWEDIRRSAERVPPPVPKGAASPGRRAGRASPR